MLIAELILWISVAATVLLGAGVPAFLWLAARVAQKPATHAVHSLPVISILMTAFHAEEGILERLRRILDSEYPADRLEVILLCSPEGELTAEVARTLDDSRLRILQFRAGVSAHQALESAMESARGELVVCIDPEARFSRGAMARFAHEFRDPSLGMVCARIGSTLESPRPGIRRAGWLSSWLSIQESAIDAYLPVTPVVAAARRSLWRFVPGMSAPDPMATADHVRRQGLRIAYLDAGLVCGAGTGHDALRFGWNAWQARGHRLDRVLREAPWLWRFWSRRDIALFWLRHLGLWVCPVLMLMALAANCSLCNDPGYLRLLLIHEGLYLVALLIIRRQQNWNGGPAPDVVFSREFSRLSLSAGER